MKHPLGWFLCLGLLSVGCADVPTTESMQPESPETSPGTLELTATSIGESSRELSAAVAANAVSTDLDPSLSDMALIGNQDGWSLYFDKRTNLIVASNSETSIALDPSEIDQSDPSSFSSAGLPESIATSWQGIACRSACWGAAGAGCAAVSFACTGVTAVSVGGFAIPCSWAIIAGCGAVSGGASVCGDYCTQWYG